MSIKWAVILIVQYFITFEAMSEEDGRRKSAFRSAFSNSIQSPMWLSPTQIYQIGGNRLDWTLSSQTETMLRLEENSRSGLESTLTGQGIGGAFLSRYPSAAAGRVGLLLDYVGLKRDDSAVNEILNRRTKVMPDNSESIPDQENRRISIEPVFAYTLWEMLSIGASYQLRRLDASNDEVSAVYNSQALKIGAGIFSARFEFGAFAEFSRRPSVQYYGRSEDGGLGSVEAGTRAYNSGGVLARAAVLDEWNIGVSRTYTAENPLAHEEAQPIIIRDRFVLEFVGDMGSLEGFMEQTENFRVKHPLDEVIIGKSRRFGASLLLKSSASAKYGISASSSKSEGSAFSSDTADLSRESISVKGSEIRLLGYMAL